jgi:hypothetical protein
MRRGGGGADRADGANRVRVWKRGRGEVGRVSKGKEAAGQLRNSTRAGEGAGSGGVGRELRRRTQVATGAY